MSEPVSDQNHRQGCLVCGAALDYAAGASQASCHYCGRDEAADVRCAEGHFVCDTCHELSDGSHLLDMTGDPARTGKAVGIDLREGRVSAVIDEALRRADDDQRAVIEAACKHSTDRHMAPLLQRLRAHPKMKIHGPEHHAMVPGVILANYRAHGGEVTDEVLGRAVRRGAKVPGGHCGFWGACGAGVGVGLAFGAILGSSPVKGEERGLINEVTSRVLARLAALRAPRCCHRDSMLALQAAAEFSSEYLDVTLRYGDPAPCDQVEKNKECIEERCPLYPGA